MLVHTVADRIYYDNFWYLFNKTSPLPINLRIVGKFKVDYSQATYDEYEIEDLSKKYNVSHEEAKGYYCLRKWQTIPEDQDSIITDIDVYFTKNFNFQYISTLLKKYDAVNLSRIKDNARVGGQMSIAISKRISKDVNLFSFELEKKEKMIWDLDTKCKDYLYAKYRTLDLVVCQDVITGSAWWNPTDPLNEIQIYKPWMYYARGMSKDYYEGRLTFEQKRDSLYEHFRTHNQS